MELRFPEVETPDATSLEKGRLLFAGETEFVKGVVAMDGLPPADRIEVCFAGRSNVGKSSLINTLLNRKKLVKTSSTPGRTQLINFFDINHAFGFVDLPGYGYARVPAAVKKRWGPMIETYLKKRDALKGVVLIIDIRRHPGEEEIGFIDWLAYYGLAHTLVLTKVDKLARSKQINRQRAIAEILSLSPDNLILFSAKSRAGKDVLWDAIDRMMHEN